MASFFTAPFIASFTASIFSATFGVPFFASFFSPSTYLMAFAPAVFRVSFSICRFFLSRSMVAAAAVIPAPITAPAMPVVTGFILLGLGIRLVVSIEFHLLVIFEFFGRLQGIAPTKIIEYV